MIMAQKILTNLSMLHGSAADSSVGNDDDDASGGSNKYIVEMVSIY
jgi:hypothetical protein